MWLIISYNIRRKQEYYGHQWNEIGKVLVLGDKVVYHFARPQNELTTTQPWQVRHMDSEDIVHEWFPPYASSGWAGVVGKGLAVFAGQHDIPNDPNHLSRPSGHGAHWQPTYVVIYNGIAFQHRIIPGTDTVNEFYSLTYDPKEELFIAGEVDYNNPRDWSGWPLGGGVWMSHNALNWARFWQDPFTCDGVPMGRLIQVKYLNGHTYAICNRSTLDGVCPSTVMNSIYQVTPSVNLILNYNVEDIPFQSPQVTWKERVWSDKLMSFDGKQIHYWKGNVPSGHLWPIGLDNEGNMLVRLCKEDWTEHGYTILRVYDIDGDLEYVADNWMKEPLYRNTGATVGGMTAPNDKFFYGMFMWTEGQSSYAALDVLNIKEGVEQKLKLDQEDLDEIRQIVKEEVYFYGKEFAKVYDSFVFWQQWIESNKRSGKDWLIGLPGTWWHVAGDEKEDYFYEHYWEHVYDDPEWIEQKPFL